MTAPLTTDRGPRAPFFVPLLAQVLVLGLNHLLRSDAWAGGRLAAHAGRSVRFVLAPLDARLTLVVNSDGTVAEASLLQPDVEVRLPAQAALSALRGREALLREAHIIGAADFAEDLGVVLRQLRWDFEEDLSRVIGDIPAHRAAGLARRFLGWQREAAGRLAENAAEYLRHEQGVLAGRQALGGFGVSVQALRDDLARIEQRLRVLEAARRHPRPGDSRVGDAPSPEGAPARRG